MSEFNRNSNVDRWYALIDNALANDKYYHCRVQEEDIELVKELVFQYEESRRVWYVTSVLFINELKDGILRIYDANITAPELKKIGRLDNWIEDFKNAIERDEKLVEKYKNIPSFLYRIEKLRKRIADFERGKAEMEAVRDDSP